MPGIKTSLILILLTFSFASNLTAQITINGNPSDWANFYTNPLYPTNAYTADANSTNDNQFTQGSQDPDQLINWTWNIGNTNNKGDISNAGAILTVVNGRNILYFCGDRLVNNGAADIGFWFFKNEVSPLSTGKFGPGTHANGDLLILTNFTIGGAKPNFEVHKWQGVTSTSAGSLGPALSVLTGTNGATNFGVANSAVPAGFTYPSAVYPDGDFFEGSLDLTTFGIPPCFTTFLLETRNSPSINASLQDLAAHKFTQTISPPSTTGAERCGDGSVTLSASGCSGGTLKWYDDPTAGTKVNEGTSYTLNITATKTFYVSCTTADGCLSARTPVTATRNPVPSVDGLITTKTGVTFVSDDIYNINIALTGTAAFTAIATGGGGSYTYVWKRINCDGSAFVDDSKTTFSSTGSNGAFTVTNIQGLGDAYCFKVTVSDGKSCVAEDIVQIRPSGSCPPCGILGATTSCKNAQQTYTYGDPNTNHI